MSKRNKLKEMILTAPILGQSQREPRLSLSEQRFGKTSKIKFLTVLRNQEISDIQENLGLS